jgi:3'-phosphoadenosine 5'-phosphosulfate sulfotransferase (PAPS reductase)/FAD synthetase
VSASLFPDRHPEGFVFEAHEVLDRAIRLYRPRAVYGLFSGGHDSLCSTHVAACRDEFTAAVHINTGIGVRQTREYVRATCAALGWPLVELHPPPFRVPPAKRKPGIDYENLPAYEALVLHHGFPGPAGHRLAYNRLKERCLRHLRRDALGRRRRPGDVMLLVGGMRRAESARRMGTTEEMSLEAGEGRAWCAPLTYWTDEDKDAYMAANRLPRNPVVGRLCLSGECLCGAFARPEEYAQIAHAYPEAAAEIRRLEGLAKEAGVHCVWGTRPPREAAGRDEAPLFSLCWSCGHKAGGALLG